MIACLALLLAALPQEPAPPREPGLSVYWYFIGEPIDELLPLVPGQTPNVARRLEAIDMVDADLGGLEDAFLTHAHGWLEVPSAGEYTLRLHSDDGSKLYLDGQVVIDHDGPHGPSDKDVVMELAVGSHPLDLWHFESYGGWALRLSWKRPGADAFEVIPSSALSCAAGEVRVTAPGKKRLVRPLEKGRPGDSMPLDAAHPALTVQTIRPAGFEPKVGGLAWTSDGRLLVATWDAIGAVYALSGATSGDASQVTLTRFAAGLAEPLGLVVWNNRVFVVQKQELTELIDLDGDGVCDVYRAVCSAWGVSPNFHEFTFGLVEKQGFLYLNLAIAIDPGGKSTRPQVAGRGSVLKVDPESGRFEIVAHGLRTPNGIGLGPDGSILITDNQGDWLPSSKLLRLEQNAFYGSRAVLGEFAAQLPVRPPVAWLPQNDIGNSPSQPSLIPAGFGPYSGQVAHADVTYGGLQRDAIEVVDGVWQASVMRWTQGLEAGMNRLVAGPDGALYVGGVGATGNWGQDGKLKYGLQRIAWRGGSVFDVLALRAKTRGFEVEFTEPLAEGTGWEAENWFVEDWTYVPTEQYGGPKIDERRLTVRAVSVSEDRRKVALQIDDLAPDRVVHLRVVGPLTDTAGAKLWSTEAWYTLNKIPTDRPLVLRPAPPPKPQNVLSDAERKAGWKLLFDGRDLIGWHNFKGSGAPRGWTVLDGAIVRTGDGGDLVTDETYPDFELALEWRIPEGGNSGVFFHVADAGNYVWESGPEMQILDNDRHPDGRNPLTSAGSNYALDAPPADLTRPIGMWNSARLVVKGPHVEHWLNGEKVVEYELWTAAWKAAVAASKFARMPDYGVPKSGRIALQDHGDRVEFRNVKLRVP
jgi:cytochrome c